MAGALPSLVVITDWSLGRAGLLGRLREVCALGPRVAVQHRHPGAPLRLFLDEARELGELCAANHNPLFVNGRLDVALLVGAHLHLPSHGLIPAQVRPLWPAGRWISAAVHDEDEAALAEGADLALVSPVFPAGSKPDDGRAPLGPGGFSRLAGRLRCPAFALGGIDGDHARAVPDARGFAAISAVLRDPHPAAAALRILARGGTLLA